MTHEDQSLVIQNCSVRWDAYNVKVGVNDTFTKDGNEVTVLQGFYTFSSLKKFLGDEGITIEKNADGRVNLTPNKDLNLKKFGVLLGCREDQNIPKDSKVNSKHTISLGLNLREIDVECSLLDSFKNFDYKGEPSDFLLSIPVDTSQLLFGSITHYDFKNVEVPCKQFYGHDIEFEVFSSHETTEYDYEIYLRLEIKGLD